MVKQNKINLFSPGFGTHPATFLGRRAILSALNSVVQGEDNSVFRRTLISGVRGVGKTTLLNEADKVLTKSGAIVVTQTSSPLLGRHLLRALAAHIDPLELQGMEFTVNLGIISGKVDLKNQKNTTPDIYLDGVNLLDAINAKSRWIVFQIDEVHGHVEAVHEFAKAFQQWLSNGYKVMLVMAGLPDELHALLNGQSVSFLRRAKQVGLAPIQNVDEITAMYTNEFKQSGKEIKLVDAKQLAEISEGYPYLIQLLGYYAWEQTNLNGTFSATELNDVYALAKRDMYASVFDLLFQNKSQNDIAYMRAIGEVMNDGVASTSDAAKAWGKTIQYASMYRKRAIDSALISADEYGKISFTIPMEINYINDMAAGKVVSSKEVMD
ncbi:MAG: ATP-binding protein [Lactobacillaceae bacterium]|jgi:hypothetical protein|nr:ATP-binding protein [Lactobacillaceae bacterium]